MLSYQHAYHAGNLADVHKHALLALTLDYLTQKDKPLSYIDTHSGRGLYDLSAPQAQQTGEAQHGITRLQEKFSADHPYLRALNAIKEQHGTMAYPGSPMIAQSLLRAGDHLHLAELHPREFTALKQGMSGANTHLYHQDGFALAQSLCPPMPRRGVMLIDPSWEMKSDYDTLPRFTAALMRKWNVGIVMLWYPILTSNTHLPMLRALQNAHEDALRHEISFPPAREGHRMVGSGMFIIRPPYGLAEAATSLSMIMDAPNLL